MLGDIFRCHRLGIKVLKWFYHTGVRDAAKILDLETGRMMMSLIGKSGEDTSVRKIQV